MAAAAQKIDKVSDIMGVQAYLALLSKFDFSDPRIAHSKLIFRLSAFFHLVMQILLFSSTGEEHKFLRKHIYLSNHVIYAAVMCVILVVNVLENGKGYPSFTERSRQLGTNPSHLCFVFVNIFSCCKEFI